MRVLVTGGTGYLGRAIVSALARRGHEPIVFARAARAAVAGGLEGRGVDGDVRDGAAIEAAAAGCDAVCHTAALVSIWRRNRSEFDAVNLGGLRNVLRCVERNAIRRLVYTSSFLARPPSDRADVLVRGNDYQRTKLEAERLAAAACADGAPLVRLYPGVIYGPGVVSEGNLVGRLVADHLRGRLPGIVGADRIWSFAFVHDVADAHVTALERAAPGSAYALGGENAPQVRAFELVRQRTGRPLPRRIPLRLAWGVGALEELRARVTNSTPRLTRGAVDVLRHDWAMDSSSAIRGLDYRITPLERGISALLDSLNQSPAGASNLQP